MLEPAEKMLTDGRRHRSNLQDIKTTKTRTANLRVIRLGKTGPRGVPSHASEWHVVIGYTVVETEASGYICKHL